MCATRRPTFSTPRNSLSLTADEVAARVSYESPRSRTDYYHPNQSLYDNSFTDPGPLNDADSGDDSFVHGTSNSQVQLLNC